MKFLLFETAFAQRRNLGSALVWRMFQKMTVKSYLSDELNLC